MSLPVLGVPILNRPELLDKMLKSIDVEVDQLVIVDNGSVVEDHLDGAPGVRVIRPGRNLGVAASWNLIVQTVPDAPWWCIANSDIEFGPGDLIRLIEHMETYGGLVYMPLPIVMGVSADTVSRAGLWDENFIPAYFEDNDFEYRCRLAGVKVDALPAGTLHEESATIRSDSTYFTENARTFPMNAAYYERKWGGLPRHEVFTTPFNAGGDLRDWHLEPGRLAEMSWKIGR